MIKKSDLKRFAAIFKLINPNQPDFGRWFHKEFLPNLSEKYDIIELKEGERLIGCAFLENEKCKILDMGIDPTYNYKKVAAALIQETLNKYNGHCSIDPEMGDKSLPGLLYEMGFDRAPLRISYVKKPDPVYLGSLAPVQLPERLERLNKGRGRASA